MGDHRVPVRNSHGDTSTKNPQACTDRLTTIPTVVRMETNAQEKSSHLMMTSLVRRLGFLGPSLQIRTSQGGHLRKLVSSYRPSVTPFRVSGFTGSAPERGIQCNPALAS